MKRRWSVPARMMAVAVVAAAGSAAGASGLADHGRSAGLTVVARFVSASPVIVGNEVKTSGVTVGEVTAMSVRDGKAHVALALDAAALPVHRDARVTVRPLSLLGERYLDLDRGSPQAAALRDGDVIPERQTGQNPDLDEVLNTVDEPTGQSMAALVTMLGEGMRGNGENAAKTVEALASSMRRTDELARVLNGQNALLNRLVDRLEPVAQGLADDHGRTLDRLVGSSTDLLATTSAESKALRKTLAGLPRTLRSARTMLAELAGTARRTTPVLRSLRPVTGDLDAISVELRRFTAAANPALASARPVLEKARRLLDEARPVAAALSRTGPDVRSVFGSLDPLTAGLTADLDSVLNFVRNWALATNGADGVSHYWRVMLTVDTKTVTGALPDGGSPIDQQPPAAKDLPKLPDPGTLLSPSRTSDGGWTGLTPLQESSALNFLIGGQ